jgi:hypothetical protein
VVVVFRELPPSVVALDSLGLSLKLTFNGGAVAAQYCYARRAMPWPQSDLMQYEENEKKTKKLMQLDCGLVRMDGLAPRGPWKEG